jgi:ATP-dependent DNA helicase RecG
VGRGAIESFCVLLYHAPLGQQSRERLGFLRDHSDGFALAEFDLEQRGPGEVLGTKQTGNINFKIAVLHRDQKLLPKVQKIAESIINLHSDIVPLLIKRWIGAAEVYKTA